MALGKFKNALRDFEIVAKAKPRDKDAKQKFEECSKVRSVKWWSFISAPAFPRYNFLPLILDLLQPFPLPTPLLPLPPRDFVRPQPLDNPMQITRRLAFEKAIACDDNGKKTLISHT